jgi:thiamine-phosphate pyrophosphorylase
LSEPPAPRLYIVTDRQLTGGRPLVDVVAAALRGTTGCPPGTVAVQLREKDLPLAALLPLARALRAVTAAAGASLYINDRADVAVAVGADGVHLSGVSLTPADAARAAPGLALAVSAHAAADVAAARATEAPIAFALFGPVNDTPAKRRYGPPVGVAALREAAHSEAVRCEAVHRAPLPLLAIGGITVDDVPAMRRAGAHGVACIRALMAAPDPEQSAWAFCQQLI